MFGKFTLSADNTGTIGKQCPACGVPFAAGDALTLVMLGPGADENRRWCASKGLVYNAVAIPIHWECSEEAYQ
jgi:hypothetical protein